MRNINEELERFKEMLICERGLSYNTVQSYVRDIRLFSDFCYKIHNVALPKLSSNEVSDLFMQYRLYSHKSSRSIRRLLSSLRQFSYYLLSEEIINEDFCLNIFLRSKIDFFPRSLTRENIQFIFDTLKRKPPSLKRNRILCIVGILYGTGIRVSELLCIKIQDISLIGDAFINIHGKGGIGRLVPLSKTVQEYLNIWLENRLLCSKLYPKKAQDFLFPAKSALGHYSRFCLYNDMKKIFLDLNVTPHSFRHSFATHMLEDGLDIVDLQKVLGHSSISSTQIYINDANRHLADELSKKHPLSFILTEDGE